MKLGVVIVTYAAQDVIASCLETLVSSAQSMRIVVVDNASPDQTVAVIENWRKQGAHLENLPFSTPRPSTVKGRSQVELVQSPVNGGFAAGVNIGLRRLLEDREMTRFWILNPDTLVPAETPIALAQAPDNFALMGCRLLYAQEPHCIQIDAGTVNPWTGVTGNINLGERACAPLPNVALADFISGASMVASRSFLETAGLMPEEYFLYYEEVDWARRRGAMPLALCKNAVVYHRAGTAIGSPTLGSIASPFSVYHKHRARMMYLQTYHPFAIPTGYAYGIAKAFQYFMSGHKGQSKAVLRALHGVKWSADIAPQSGHQTIERRA
ncbi:MAG: glycosyltransferase family 2 protein [Pseudomonadota bacterium]